MATQFLRQRLIFCAALRLTVLPFRKLQFRAGFKNRLCSPSASNGHVEPAKRLNHPCLI